MAFTPGQSIMYNSICCTIIKTPGKRLFSQDSNGYLIRENKSGLIHDDILEADLMTCNNLQICNEVWDDFIYTGNNKDASKWIIDNLIKSLLNINGLEWGHNDDNTEYFFIIDGTTFRKNKT